MKALKELNKRLTYISVGSLFSGEKQYIIPLFQRHYVWEEDDQWEPLWEDIKKTCQKVSDEPDGQHFHFTGVIIIQPKDVNVNEVRKIEIIDGQQRLTTFQIILCALRDVCEEYDFNDIQGEIEKHIRNQDHISNDEQYKLIPTEHDITEFISLIDKTSDNSSEHIRLAYDYFLKKIKEHVKGDEQVIRTLFDSICKDFALVQIRLSSDDQPERIFESLNARGKNLLQFDLLRNNLFLRARIEEDRDSLYKDYWKHFEDPYWHREVKPTKEDTFSELFLRHFLMAKLGSENVEPLFNKYMEKVADTESDSIQHEFSELKRYSDSYREMTDCPDDTQIGRAMLFYKTLELTTLHPFILFIVNELSVSGKDLSYVLGILESYTMRRLVCSKRQGTKNYNKFFSRLIRVLRKDGFSLATFTKLLSDEEGVSTKWPTDDVVKEYLKLGGWKNDNISPKFVRYILYRIELLKQKEHYLTETHTLDFEELTLEHIMPQKWETTWELPRYLPPGEEGKEPLMYEDMFTDEYKANNPDWETERSEDVLEKGLTDTLLEKSLWHAILRKIYLHSIGNLTLVTDRHNSSLSNDTFPDKKESLYKNSVLTLNRIEICENDTWDYDDIKERATNLLTYFYKIWPSPEDFLKRVK